MDKAVELLSWREYISNAAVVFQVENLTHPGQPMNRDEISLTCPFRTSQRRMQCVSACRQGGVCEPPERLKLVAWGRTPQVEMAAITRNRAATEGGGTLTMTIPLRVSLRQRRARTHR